MDDATRREIDKASWKALREAGIFQPPVRIETLLAHLRLYREFYDLEDPGFLDRAKHRIRIHGRRLVDILRKVRLAAVLLYDDRRIVVDLKLPSIKRDFPSFHEVAHRIFVWHRPFFYGDTAQTLDPDWHEQLEAEANYGASSLMFCGPVFTREALDTTAKWLSIVALKKRYGKSYVTTLRRYVEHTHDHSMAMLVSTPHWEGKPSDQAERWRHFVGSKRFAAEFASVTASDVLEAVDGNCVQCRGGLVADFTYCLKDENGDLHEFHAESFYNRHYILTLFVEVRRLGTNPIVVPQSVNRS